MDKQYSAYTTSKQTLESEGDIVKVILFEGIIDYSSKEQLESAIVQIDAAIESVNSLDGVEVSYEKLSDTSIKDKARYDLESASISTLQQLGLLSSDDAAKETKLISLKKSVTALESSGFTCKTK
ncbi:hypothetical protein AOC36_00725 [Erysipelothrix larvae]|uniref:Uncharacterized protein n=2 Tax=Erysipelothrix larvae TaxID=1514105 RepID=A0A120JTD8_9FIRM|nr:hypothetical protein AOC36_00725 [Erysipelothrix larvae]